MAKVYVRDFATRSVVQEIEVSFRPDGPAYRQFEMGLLRNMDLDKYYLDDDDYQKQRERAAQKDRR